ncbi:MAG: hypothetical protein RL693_2148 [Verrucomicrobiota bacterium]|jgi:hypothetical protein
MTFNVSQTAIFRKLLALALLALALLGAISLCMKEIPLALFGERAFGIVKEVEIIQTGTTTRWENKSSSSPKAVSSASTLTIMHIDFSTKDGKPVSIKTVATFHTEAKVGDTPLLLYLPSNPANAKIYSAKQLWLPMGVGIVFVSVCSFLGLRLLRPKKAPTVPGGIGAPVRQYID